MARIEIRLLRPGDAAVLSRVAEDVFDYPIDQQRTAAYLRDEAHLLFVAIADGIVVGQARGVIHLHPDAPDELYIDNLGVTPAFHRQGIGRALIAALMKEGQARGCLEAWVGTESGNIPARTLYESFGDKGEESVFFLFDLPPGKPVKK